MEFCITDLRAKLMSGLLKRELIGYLDLAKILEPGFIAVIGAEKYDHMVYAQFNGVMQDYKSIYSYLPMTPEKAIEKTVKLIQKPPVYHKELAPVLVSAEKKGFVLSISALMDGISTGLGRHLADAWHVGITEGEISTVVNGYFNANKPPGRHREFTELPNKIYQAWLDTWGKELYDEDEEEEKTEYVPVNTDDLYEELSRL